MTNSVAILEAHTDEVWDIQWSHNGAFLGSASRDKSAIIWRKASSPVIATSTNDWSVHRILRGHTLIVERLAWSLDDKVLLTSSQDSTKMWDTETGQCIRTLELYQYDRSTITSLCWLPDGTGFVTGFLENKILFWNEDGKVTDIWDHLPTMITDIAITPDATRLVSIGNETIVLGTETEDPRTMDRRSTKYQARLIVHNLATKDIESSIQLESDLTSIRILSDSQFALINQSSPVEICLLDLHSRQSRHCYKGHKQGCHVIRSCFGGFDGTFITSGSEDGNVYLWDRNGESLLETLSGHGGGSVNTVAWSPNNHSLASCSDDHTIRIWEIPSSGSA